MNVNAIVTLTVEVSPGDSWGKECSIDQVHKQGSESAVRLLHEAIRRAGLRSQMRMVGAPAVKAVIADNHPKRIHAPLVATEQIDTSELAVYLCQHLGLQESVPRVLKTINEFCGVEVKK